MIEKIEKMELKRPADCLAVQTRAQTRLEAEETKLRPKKADDGEPKFDICDTETLIKLQETDPSLTRVMVSHTTLSRTRFSTGYILVR